ncbi:MAG TPA: M28 family metallopeptidase [Steroidobacteraceae bacterium]|nr:M28 family metallopeptidase [Steroidobacteraceae bacterium]
MKHRTLLLSLSMGAACAVSAATAPAAGVDPARLLQHIKVLESDEFEGRLPGTVGEQKSVAYITGQFKQLGLTAGNPNGTYLQDVPLEGIAGSPSMALTAGGRAIPMEHGHDFVASTYRIVPQVLISNSPLVFVGYGVQAPEYNWDDYKGLDAHGKTLVMLINDPPVEDPKHPGQLDDKVFKGKAMTYYGRWTYKFEMASKLGADGVLIVHETIPAAYDWSVVEHSWSGEAFVLADANGNAHSVPVQGWITLDKARALFAQSGQSFEALKVKAASREFKPVALNATVSVSIQNKLRDVHSHNVVASLPGSDPKLSHEWIVYTAHWDHFGRNPSLSGDQIFHGAVDNGSGVASILEIARVFSETRPKPKRSILFMAVTAEEQGLLGSKYYAEHPLHPLNETLADLNIDSVGTWGRARDLQVIGFGQSSLDDDLAQVLKSEDRVMVPDQQPEQGGYFRSDQFSFARVGVPGLFLSPGVDVIGKPAGFGQQQRDEYEAHRYHSPADRVYPDWDLSGAAQDDTDLYKIGLALSAAAHWPEWRADSEFRAIRIQSLATRSKAALDH